MDVAGVTGSSTAATQATTQNTLDGISGADFMQILITNLYWTALCG